MKFPKTQSFIKSEAKQSYVDKYFFVKCVVCATWDEEFRTIEISMLSVAFNHEQLEAF